MLTARMEVLTAISVSSNMRLKGEMSALVCGNESILARVK